MNLLPFDIEKVKAGAKFCHISGWIPEAYQVTDYGIVVLWKNDRFATFYNPSDFYHLRLLPEKKEVWINVWYAYDKFYLAQFNSLEESKTEKIRVKALGAEYLETIHKTYTI